MIGEKFYQNISTLTNSELNSCVRMSKNSFFNKREEVSETIELFKKNKNRFFSLLNDEKKLFFILFSNEKQFKRRLLLDHFHYCGSFIEDCIIQHSIQNNKEKRLEILQEFYIKNDKTKEALSLNNQLHKIIEKKKINIDNYYQSYKFHISKFNILVANFDSEIFENIQLAMNELDKFYFLAKLSLNQELESNKLHNKREYSVVLVDEINIEIKKNPKLCDDIHFQIFKLTSNLYSGKGNNVEYFILKNLIFDNIDSFDAKNQKALLTDLSNYSSIMYSRNGDVELLKEYFKIYKLTYKKRLLVNRENVHKNDFTQIINVAVFLKEFDWAIDFLNENEKFIENKTSVILSRAQIAYKLEEFDKVLDLLNKVNSTRYAENTLAKTLYAKTLYCTRKYDLLESSLNAYELYLRRQKKIDEELKDKNTRFVLYFKRLYKNIHNQDKIEKLKSDLAKDMTVHNRNWLISRIEKLT